MRRYLASKQFYQRVDTEDDKPQQKSKPVIPSLNIKKVSSADKPE